MLLKSVTFLVVLSVALSDHRTRRKLECTNTILRNALERSDQNFFRHVEGFLQRHSTTRILASFLNEGYLVVGMRFIIKVHRTKPQFLPDYLFLKTISGLGNRYFSDKLQISGLQAAKFLRLVKMAFIKAYYNRKIDSIAPEGSFKEILLDNMIETYFRNISIEPVIMYVESNITYRGLDLHLIEVSVRDKEKCFFKTNKRNTPCVNCSDEDKRKLNEERAEERAVELYTKAREIINLKLEDYANTSMWSTVENGFDVSLRGVEYYLIKPIIKIVFDFIKEKAGEMVEYAVNEKFKDTVKHLKNISGEGSDLLLGDDSFLRKLTDLKEYEKIELKFSEVMMSLLRTFVERSSSLFAEILWSHATNTNLSTYRKLRDIVTCIAKKGNATSSTQNATEKMALLYSFMQNSTNCAASE